VDWIKIFSSVDEMKKALTLQQPRLLVVRGKRVCLVRRDHELLAVEDSCPHNGESLSKGTVNYIGEVVCPWHGQRFSLKTGRECAERSRDLVTYPVKENIDGVFIAL
jgi:nitrite reductase/ring-hydroxylating ferredoxin subunit